MTQQVEEAGLAEVDVLVAGLGPGGCMAALLAHQAGLSTLAVEARGPEASRMRLVLVRPRAQELLRQIGMADITQGRRTSTIKQVEERLRAALVDAAAATTASTTQSADASSQPAAIGVAWHTRLTALDVQPDRVVVTLRDEAGGRQRRVAARHLIDATGGRLEAIGRPARRTVGPRHVVVTAEFETAPWFDGIVGAHDGATREALILVPMRGRVGITAYLDTPPGSRAEPEALLRRFDEVAARLALVHPRQPPLAVDVVQRVLARASHDRVVPIGDSAGTVDLWLGAGMSTAIEDAWDAAQGIAAAQREPTPRAEQARTRAASQRIVARHRSRMRMGRLMVFARPLLVRLWPGLPWQDIRRDVLRSPRGLWQGMRLLAGRRPPDASKAPAEKA
jgi:2-polyprenyl-6-methoxyphenol hydroxylase-like FAD-dependent oxidoreductase